MGGLSAHSAERALALAVAGVRSAVGSGHGVPARAPQAAVEGAQGPVARMERSESGILSARQDRPALRCAPCGLRTTRDVFRQRASTPAIRLDVVRRHVETRDKPRSISSALAIVTRALTAILAFRPPARGHSPRRNAKRPKSTICVPTGVCRLSRARRSAGRW